MYVILIMEIEKYLHMLVTNMLKPEFVCEFCNNTKFTELSMEEHEKACILVNTMKWSSKKKNSKKRGNFPIENYLENVNAAPDSILSAFQQIAEEMQRMKHEMKKMQQNQYVRKRRYIKDYLNEFRPYNGITDWIKSFPIDDEFITVCLANNVMYGVKQLFAYAIGSYTNSMGASPLLPKAGTEGLSLLPKAGTEGLSLLPKAGTASLLPKAGTEGLSLLPKAGTASLLPIMAFKQKIGIFYIYENNTWRESSSEDFANIYKELTSRINKYFYTNYEKFANEDIDIDSQNQKKICLYGESIEKSLAYLKKWLFEKIAISIPGIE